MEKRINFFLNTIFVFYALKCFALKLLLFCGSQMVNRKNKSNFKKLSLLTANNNSPKQQTKKIIMNN